MRPPSPGHEAAAILHERRFHATPVPQPLRQPLHDLGTALGRLIDSLAADLPGGHVTAWALVVAAVALVAAVLAGRGAALRRRRAETADARPGVRGQAPEDPAQLQRSAAEAERRGDFNAAIRLRFRAGLLSLGRRQAITLRASTTSGDVARELRMPAFADLAAAFDEVAYGGRTADAGAAERARRTWPRVIDEAGSRSHR